MSSRSRWLRILCKSEFTGHFCVAASDHDSLSYLLSRCLGKVITAAYLLEPFPLYIGAAQDAVNEANYLRRLSCEKEFLSWKGETRPCWFDP